ncbi:MAG TPA: multifunctional CCA addition/repair protein [Casimicrobium huifangae]|mgnify:FL=1|jgi:tRNA nucleotidyltransferase (CCA-adding enzyme)|uniref:multifunctional CCA addition/repair protein n=1 Tax=Casimicrobium huifangae TaxID=2591109 RepID=UPI0012EB7A18|nr:multifunctional CCA addition/repair protein [Casimicrobium huifangae]HOB02672.1 multifunctional CCA addition/repair protein [Casimicrobium huifangae]HQA34686.1 multifunctional CCA addition/repair protein [Casimicrobium huifangae]HQD64797.1 multifunctional CCA addition/repair protein [Casimicrobium huifangae]
MKIYLVGGSVRDRLLGLPASDRDYVVVGATPEQMLASGYQPVGKDFPVFLHPQTKEEYALARTERKSGRGYTGFAFHAAPDVTLEDDLHRRDLTINAMALDENGQLVDPYGGARDIASKTLRHVSEAFPEDPLRVLRLARFAARFTEFSVAPETMALCRQLVDEGEIRELVAERVWQELSRGLMEAQPSRMFGVLRDCGALAVLAPELDRLWGVPQKAIYHPEIDTGIHIMQVIDYAANRGWPLATRYAALTHDLGKGLTPADILPAHHAHEARSAKLVDALSARWRVQREVAELARAVAAEHGNLGKLKDMRPATVHDVLMRCDAIRRPERFVHMLDACEADKSSRRAVGLPESAGEPFVARADAMAALAAMQSVDAGAIAAQLVAAGKPERIAAEVRDARIAAIRDRRDAAS